MALKTATSTSASGRIIRTVFQVLVAVAASAPLMVGTLHLSAAQSTEVSGVVGLVVIIITSVHNGLEQAGILPAMFKGVDMPVATATEVAAAQKIAPQVVQAASEATALGQEAAPIVAAAQGKSTSKTPPAAS